MEEKNKGVKYNAEFLDAVRRKKTKNITEEELDAEKLSEEYAKKVGFRKLM